MIPFDELKIDALLLTDPSNIRYLSGFTGDNAMVVAAPGAMTLFTDPRFTIQASQQCFCVVKTISKGTLDAGAVDLIRRKRWKRIGFEASRMTFDVHQRIKEALPLGVSLKPLGGVVEKLRMVKTAGEIARIRLSVEAAATAFQKTARSLRPGVSESAIAAELEFQMRRLGAEKPAFETIVAVGARSALPHAQPSRQKTAVNELLLIDMGAFLDGYASDMTRMIFFGKPSRRIKQMYKAVATAQLAAIDAVRAGVEARQVDQKARQVLEAEGLGKEFVHSTGHGLGLEIHEPPRIGKRERTRLQAGMVITIEPGAYIRDFGGIRIEDTVLVTKDGCEVLTPTSKELMLL